jgi:hypothetical protein
LAAAAKGEEIWVAAGTYYPDASDTMSMAERSQASVAE